jgi:Uma2 family endonuclease
MAVQVHPRQFGPKSGEVYYPESDGKPMAENTLQYRWIVLLIENIRNLFAHDPNVFVAGDLLWYPEKGNAGKSLAPDCMVVFGRPQGDRGSYRQWEEGGLAPQVVFEVLSPGNTAVEMRNKLRDYERYGVEEVYYYDPQRNELRAWTRQQGRLIPVSRLDGFQSPRLKIRFRPGPDGLKIERPDGAPFESFLEIAERARREHECARQEQQRAEQEQQRAEEERRRAEKERQRAERMAEKLRTLGIDPDSV